MRMPCHITDGPVGGMRDSEGDDEPERHMMSHNEFTASMDEVKLTQADLAKLTGVYPKSVWRWMTGRSPVPDYAWTIIRDRKKIRELTLELCK